MSDQHQADRDRASARAGLKDLGRGRGRLDQGTCRGCGAGVLWTVTAGGKKMPLDPKPVSGIDVESGEVRRVRVSHFATCPNAGDFRRPKQPELGLTERPRRWPAGTDPWTVIDEELGPAYETEDELAAGDPALDEARAKGAMVGGAVLRELVRAMASEPAPIDIGEPGARAKLTRFLTYRALGVAVLVRTSEQSHPPVVWVARNPRLMAAVEARIER